MADLDTRIRDALRAAAAEVREEDLRPAAPPISSPVIRERRGSRWIAPALAAAAVIAVVATSVALFGSPKPAQHIPATGTRPSATSSSTPAPAPHAFSSAAPHTSSSARPQASSSAAPEQSTISTKAPAPASTTVEARRSVAGGAPACFFADACATSIQTYYEPLWPFRTYDEARRWETVDGPNGHSPWHLDANQTALSFAAGFLGFHDITLVTRSQVGIDQAHIGVGFRDPNGGTHTAAVLHLVRYERVLGDAHAGWEVVGSDDTTFSIEQPAYGSTVSSPMTVGGRITGVDENVRVVVRSVDQIVGTAVPLPAGGDNTPWSVPVRFAGGGVLTIVASTGGHLIEHERFALQGVHTGS